MANWIHDVFYKRTKKESTLPGIGSFLPILSARHLLADEKRQELVTEFTKLVGTSTHDFNTFYLQAIHNFAEFTQELPETKSSYYAYKGGVLDHALNRTYHALRLCRAYLLPAQENATASIPQQQMLWVYAIFTASLLLDVGKVATKLYVDLYDQKNIITKRWLPFEGSMLMQVPSVHYQFDFEKENRERLKSLVTPLLARQLLPMAGFNWIASDKDVLESWLAILEDDQSGGGLIPSVIPRADAHSLEDEFVRIKSAEVAMTQEPISAEKQTTVGATTMTGQPQDSVFLPMAFLDWLRNKIANQQIKDVVRVKEGILLPRQIYKHFSEENPQYGKAPQVAEKFQKWLDLQSVDYRHFPADAMPATIKNATLIRNIRLLFSDLQQCPAVDERVILLTTSPKGEQPTTPLHGASQAIRDQFIAPKPTT